MTVTRTNLYPLSDAVMFGVNCVGVVRICPVACTGNQGGRGVKRFSEIDTLL